MATSPLTASALAVKWRQKRVRNDSGLRVTNSPGMVCRGTGCTASTTSVCCSVIPRA